MIYTVYLSSLVASAVIAAALAYYLWQRRFQPGARPAVFMMLAAIVVSLGYVWQYSSATLSAQIMAESFQYIGIVALPVTWLAFSLQYTGHGKWLTRRNLLLLLIVPAITVVIVWTNGIDGLMYQNRHLATSGPFTIISKTYGPWFWTYWAYSYLLLFGAVVLLILRMFQPPRLYRSQSIALLVSIFVPLAWNIIYVADLTELYHVDMTPAAFVISGAAIAWGLFRLRMFDVIPLAHSTMVERMRDGLMVLDREGRIVGLNRTAESIIDCPSQEAYGQLATDLLSQQPRLAKRLLGTGNATESDMEISVEEDGMTHSFECRLSPLVTGRNNIAGRLVIMHNVTERKKTEETLKECEERFRLLTENSITGTFIIQDSKMVYVNPSFAKTFGYEAEEIINTMTPSDFIHPDDMDVMVERLRDRFAGRVDNDNAFYKAVRKDGAIVNIETHTVLTEYRGRPAVIGTFIDITERIEAEKKLRRLYNSERKARRGLEAEREKRIEFTRALVHELKTPITPVLAATELLLQRIEDETSMRLVESIERSASNLNRRIDDLMDLIKGEANMLSLNLVPVDMVLLLKDLWQEMTPVATDAGHSLVVDLPPSAPEVQADSDRLRQVVQNLLNNAIKFAPTGGTITLTAKMDHASLIVEVHDTGHGMTEEDLRRLFDPYFRRVEDRERLGGLGLGLALSKRLVELHGGEMWVTSGRGKGTTFSFSLPLESTGGDEE